MADGEIADEVAEQRPARYQRIGFFLGLALFALALVTPAPAGLSLEGWRVVAVAALMASWWATEAIPVPATSLLPIVLFPLLGVTGIENATKPYSSSVIYLLLGGFIVAMAVERWNLHRRLALMVLARVGGRPDAIIFGFMAATAALSLWMSNTAATMMMLPIAAPVIAVVMAGRGENRAFAVALLLGIAYAASIGGLGTLVGTPPNALMAGYLRQAFGIEVTFAQWMLFGLPVVILLLPTAWWVLTRIAYRIDLPANPDAKAIIARELLELGPITTPEQRTLYAFAAVAAAWIATPLLKLIPALGGLSDTVIAVMGAVAVFLIPSGAAGGGRLMTWQAAVKLPWGVILLFGGGLSLAEQVSGTGLSLWIGDQLSGLTDLPRLGLIVAVATLVIFLTELTSNTATTATILPILGALAVAGGLPPLLIIAPATLAATCAFMLPVSTAPNAVVYGLGYIRIPEMARAGLILNFFTIIIVSALSYILIPLVFSA